MPLASSSSKRTHSSEKMPNKSWRKSGATSLKFSLMQPKRRSKQTRGPFWMRSVRRLSVLPSQVTKHRYINYYGILIVSSIHPLNLLGNKTAPSLSRQASMMKRGLSISVPFLVLRLCLRSSWWAQFVSRLACVK